MAKSGRKTILLNITNAYDLEDTINFAEHKANSSGIRMSVDYAHDTGLKLNIAGPKDKLNLFEHQIREFIEKIPSEDEE
ncbi:hypothetical protein NEF87_001957 [Candidatus Lokiarchaeum ossiferum]|uniref:Uncharacterized protein n=1 Tax=Candidatus Lokiarchaeum ossiferum TaxID=2951803 RepID=A0ABY6HS25_9ARCH|nr:hypothetical protein NEF87_001957 [Candidatus Lokiarchaeum sp. B-35]